MRWILNGPLRIISSFFKSNIDDGAFSKAMRSKNFASIADLFGFFLISGGIFMLLLSTVGAWISGTPGLAWTVFGLGLLLGGASFVSGWLLGLLFGIPRTLARPQPLPATPDATDTASTRRAAASRVNTNLEDVSDWLTKTLIGVGLTQLYVFPEKLWSIAGQINESGFGWKPHGQLLALALILYFAPGGFWLGYVATRTVLTKLFDSMEEAAADADIVLAQDQLQLNIKGNELQPATDPAVANADRSLLKLPMHAMETPRQLAAWGVARARVGEWPAALTAVEQAAVADPKDILIKDALAKLYTVQNRRPDAERVLRDAPPTDTAVLWALYEPAPDGFRRAIQLGETILADPKQGHSVNLRVWLACAYGQQHADAEARADEALAHTSRNKAVENVKAALNVNPGVRPWLYALWKPSEDSVDDDLKSLGDDPEVAALLAPSPSQPARAGGRIGSDSENPAPRQTGRPAAEP
ncbi:MAG: hypothetical protein PGN25_22540 [Methylorubrum populi]